MTDVGYSSGRHDHLTGKRRAARRTFRLLFPLQRLFQLVALFAGIAFGHTSS